MDSHEQDGKDGKSRAGQRAKAIGAALLLLASRLWAGMVRGWRELGRRDAADIAKARDEARAAAATDGDDKRRGSIFLWLPKRRSAVVALLLLMLLLLWRCGHDGVPAGIAPTTTTTADGSRAPVCDGLLEHHAWTGTIAFNHQRDVTDDKGEFRLQYTYELDLGAEMEERTRRQFRDRDSLVEVFSPEPRGRIKAELFLQGFDHRGLASSSKFAATGGLQKYEKGMGEDGSMMSLTLKDDCTYRFYLQGQALGEWTMYDRYKGTESSGGMLWIPGVHGDGVADNGSRLSGSVAYPLMSTRHLDELRTQQGWINFVVEQDRVEKILGRGNLGTVEVTWTFEAK